VVIPAAELAIISHHGSLADADLSYAELGSYATTREISIDGPLREYYLRGGGDTRRGGIEDRDRLAHLPRRRTRA
jgi:effector-binding domain-containing protein